MDENSAFHWNQVYSASEELGRRAGKQPEDGGSRLFRNVGALVPDYTD
jgi:hypothetical protein